MKFRRIFQKSRSELDVFAETFESRRIEFGVEHGVLDVFVPHVCLDGTGISPVISKLIAFSMAACADG